MVEVTPKAEAPGGKPGECVYCQQPFGGQHGPKCPLVKKRAKVRLSFNMEVDVPSHWDDYDIRFHYIDSSWCCDNLAEDLTAYVIRGPRDGCLCSGFHDFEAEWLEDLEELGEQA